MDSEILGEELGWDFSWRGFLARREEINRRCLSREIFVIDTFVKVAGPGSTDDRLFEPPRKILASDDFLKLRILYYSMD